MSRMTEQEVQRKDYSDWLASLKVGDEVFIRGRGIHRVQRLTATQIVIDTPYDLRCRRGTGVIVGSGYERMLKPTDELRLQVQASKNRSRLSRLTMYLTDARSQLNDEQIAAMLAAYDQLQSDSPAERGADHE
ncbi:hypothetical protein BJP27_24390 (plasmid) [Pseudomonas oryzihabitans]|nr:hypothetical protein BJP27_24390 [Pseudomonas psychrotolerans]